MSSKAVLDHFLATCSAHAYYKLTSKNKNTNRKIIWLIITVCAFVIFLYHMYTFIYKFNKNPQTTKIKYDLQTETYPSITICYNMPFYIKNFSNLVLNSQNSFSTIDQLVMQFWINYLPLLNVSYSDLFKIYFSSVVPLAEITNILVPPQIPLVKCFMDSIYDCEKSFGKVFIFENRPCISGNITRRKITSINLSIFWPYSSLHPKNNNSFINYNSFLSVYLHPLGSYPSGLPFEAAINKNLLSINYELSYHKLTCITVMGDIQILSRYNNQVLNFTYSKLLCDQIVAQRRIWNTCQCISEFLPIPHDFHSIIFNKIDNFCHAISGILLNNNSQININKIIERVKCHNSIINNMSYSCPKTCSNYKVSVFSQYINTRPDNEIVKSFVELYNNLKSTNNTNISQRDFFDSGSVFTSFNEYNIASQTEAFLQISIGFSPEVLIFESRNSFDKMTLLSEIGGIMGFYMGWSSVTVIEILVFFVELIVYHFYTF